MIDVTILQHVVYFIHWRMRRVDASIYEAMVIVATETEIQKSEYDASTEATTAQTKKFIPILSQQQSVPLQ
jgi:hypothetical protein